MLYNLVQYVLSFLTLLKVLFNLSNHNTSVVRPASRSLASSKVRKSQSILKSQATKVDAPAPDFHAVFSQSVDWSKYDSPAVYRKNS